MKKFAILFTVLLAIFIAFISCEVGLGAQIDLEAPVLTITQLRSAGRSFQKSELSTLIYCHKDVTFSGTAVDDIKMKEVYAEIKWEGTDSSYHRLGTANLSGENWTLSLNLQREGTAQLRIVAVDDAGNISSKSQKTIVLLVDETGPVGNGWYIDRGNGFVYSLKDLDALKAIVHSDPNLENAENIDVGQNVSFSIHADVNDTMGIKDGSVKIKLRDENGSELAEITSSAASNFAPEFKITSDTLSTLTTGQHYIEVLFSAEDIVTVPHSNLTEDISAGWFLWWPESDKPRAVPNITVDDDDAIHLKVKEALNITVFDDDELKSADYELASSDATGFSANKKTANFSNERTSQIILTAPDSPQQMCLLLQATDSSGVQSDLKKIPVTVTDASSPLLIISSPENNKVPQVVMSSNNQKAEITITGQTLDSAGCAFLEFVWVPDSVASTNKKEKALSYLDKINTTDEHSTYAPSGNAAVKITDGDGDFAGLKMWSAKLTADGNSDSLKKHKFSFTVDLLNDFVANSENEKIKSKYFLVKLTRTDGKSVYQEYTLVGDTQLPSITAISPASDTAIIDDGADFTFEFKGTKASGLAMKTETYKIERVDESPSVEITNSVEGFSNVKYEENSGTYKASISKETLAQLKEKGVKPKFQFSVEDLFGNKGVSQCTLVIDALPKLNSITSTASEFCRLGEEILINANFSDTVSVDSEHQSGNNRPYIKLKNISGSANNRDKAYYKSGSGSTVLTFSYTVQKGDTSDGIQVDNTNKTPIEINGTTSLTEGKNIHQNSLTDENNLQAKKKIKVDGVSPNVSSIKIESNASESENKNGNITYLKAGRKISATVNTDKNITIQGTPNFTLDVYDSSSKKTGSLILDFEKTLGNRAVVFSRVIESGDENGILKYSPSTAVNDFSYIKDAVGNDLVPQSSGTTETNFAVDTGVPSVPKIYASGTENILKSGKYKTSVTFELDSSTDNSIKKTEYSLDGGSSWSEYNSAVTLNESASLTARRTDYAGNVSDNSDVIELDINNIFPSYTVECTSSDGYYKAGSTLTFRVNFSNSVNIAAGSQAKIYLSGTDESDIVTNGAAAVLSNQTAQNGVTSATFTYTVQKTDQFTLKIENGLNENSGVHLDGITDLYGFSDTKGLSAEYTRDVVCDGVIPYITSMKPGEETANNSNIYKKGNVITINFNEPVQKGEGSVILRQVKGWAIPPVINVDDFSTILTAVRSLNNFTISSNGKNLTGTQVLYMDGAEDVRDLETSNTTLNAYYHGNGQFIGPYKKSSQGITDDGAPDTELKYVLDFEMGIWETDENHYYGTTYQGTTSPTPKNGDTVITAGNIRSVLEKIGYHERVLDVTSPAVKLSSDRKSAEITFPKGLTGTANLADGREWELVISKGAFIDYTENEFGSEYTNGNSAAKLSKDSIMQNGGTLTSELGDWAENANVGTGGRGRSSNATDPVVLIQTSNGKNAFWSDKVAEPVIRVDRYSYGIGAYQATENGEKELITKDSQTPTGFIRARIDCETKDATIKYAKSTKTGTRDTTAANDNGYSSAPEPKYIETSDTHCYSYLSKTENQTKATLKNANLTTDYTQGDFFALGSKGYGNSCKDYVVAQGTKPGFTPSEKATEGVFKTVVRFYQPTRGNGYTYLASLNDSQNAFSIRGTTGWAGEPYITPFPLRDARHGSPYLKRTYRERGDTNATNQSSYDFYWISYEILVESSLSGHGWDGNGYQWGRNWGYMHPGEFTVCVNMRPWGN